MSAEQRLEELNLELPTAPKPGGVYKPIVITGNMAYVSGHGPLCSDDTMLSGRVGSEVDEQAGYQAARQTGLAILATLKANLGSLDRVKRVIKTLGMVNCTARERKRRKRSKDCRLKSELHILISSFSPHLLILFRDPHSFPRFFCLSHLGVLFQLIF